MIKDLRAKSGVGMNDCKNALIEADGNIEKAFDILRQKGMAKMEQRADKIASAGFIGTYLHNGAILGIVVVNCETDFVSKDEPMQTFAKELAMQVVAANPAYINIADVPQSDVERELEIAKQGLEGKPENIAQGIVQGKMQKYYENICLMEQSWIKDDSKKIKDLYNEFAAKIGEKLVIKEMNRITI